MLFIGSETGDLHTARYIVPQNFEFSITKTLNHFLVQPTGWSFRKDGVHTTKQGLATVYGVPYSVSSF